MIKLYYLRLEEVGRPNYLQIFPRFYHHYFRSVVLEEEPEGLVASEAQVFLVEE